MADYYSILKKTISGLPVNSDASRRMVYDKARTAIERQLRNINPPPPEAAITRHMAQLNEAMERLEAEYAAPSAASAQPEAQQRTAPPPPARPAPAPAKPTETAAAGRAAAPAARPAVSGASSASPAPTRALHSDTDGPVGSSAARAATASAPPAAPVPYPASAPRPKPLAGDAPSYDASLDALEELDRPVSTAGKPRPKARTRNGEKRGRGLVLAVSALVVLLLLGAAGFGAWLYREPLMAALGLPAQTPQQTETASEEAVPSTPTAEEEPEQPVEKEEARLGADGQTLAPPPPDPAEESEDNPALAPATLPPVDPVSQEDQQVSPVEEQPASTTETTGTEEPEVEPQAETVPVEQAQTQPAENPAPPEAGPAIDPQGQKAYLYEEGVGGGSASRDNAAVSWTLDMASPADGLPPEPVIRGVLDVPGRGMKMDLTIKRNTDEALPASHIIELNFQTPQEFTGGSVENVARFVMKSSEQARGEGLVAVPAKIDTGYFLIALNNLQQAMETNERLLLDSSWIDIPLGYTTGRRALVTLEKGAQGDKVFRDAFADWKTR